MTETVTLNVKTSNNATRNYTMLTDNKNFINSIITVNNDGTITEKDVKRLQECARRGGDAGILEQCDLGANEKLKLAELNEFNAFYDITLSDDKKYFKVKIKETSWFIKNPTLGTIKSDFGVRDNIFIQKDSIPYGNASLIEKRANTAKRTPDERNKDYDTVKLSEGDVINIPVEEINITDTPRSGWGRLFLQ